MRVVGETSKTFLHVRGKRIVVLSEQEKLGREGFVDALPRLQPRLGCVQLFPTLKVSCSGSETGEVSVWLVVGASTVRCLAFTPLKFISVTFRRTLVCRSR